MTRRRLFSTLAAAVALLAASPVVGRVVTPPKWVIAQWMAETRNWGREFAVGVQVVSGGETRTHAVGCLIGKDFNHEATTERFQARLTEWVDNLNASKL